MTIRNLDHVNHPKYIAVIGASVRAGSVGRVVMNNILDGGFEGEVWPVNPKYDQIAGRDCYRKIKDIPGVPDVAVIITPPATVPALIRELGEKGTRVAVVITAGLTRENGLRQAMLDAAKPFLLRIIGPNTVGLMVPPAKLNASFAHIGANPGGIALLSQSGAIATALVDWAVDNHVGFSQIVSLGDMADVDVADCLDLLAGDAKTRAILMYLESIPNPRKFMSAARAAARLKPVIAIKSGRHAEAAKAAATHTGALSGTDRIIDAVLHRAGILRVEGLAELFDAAETIARFVPLQRARTSIVTNGGGAGVLAVDRLMDCNGELAVLSAGTISALDQVLPANWSRANPVDILGDATPERYRAAVEAVAADPETDVIVVLNCPTGLASPIGAAAGVAALSKNGTINGKPVLTCWLGEHTARDGRRVLQEAGVTSYQTPSDAAVAVSYLGDWSRAQKALMQVPSSLGEDVSADKDVVAAIFRQAAREGRGMLTEPEAKAAIAAYGIPVPETVIARSAEEVEMAAARLLQSCEKVVVKLLSRTLTHKSDVGGVVLDLVTSDEARKAAVGITMRLKKIAPQAGMEGFVVQPMIVRSRAQELILGVNRDPIFGPVILFGAGGVAVEVMDDTAIALPPLDDVLAGELIDRTRIARLLAGFRDRKPADRKAICLALNGLSQMLVDFPCIVAMDINPLIADSEGVVALDARIQIDPADVQRPGPNPDMAIRPYPSDWARDIMLANEAFHIRPIRPTDISLYPRFLAKVTPEDLRLRFFSKAKSIPHQLLLRLTQLDYDREMAFVALDKKSGALAGIVRLSSDPDHQVAEYGLLVRSDLKGHGLGWALLSHLVEYAADDGLKRIEGIILSENETMLTMCREFGFSVQQHPSEEGMCLATLELANRRVKQT